MITTYRQGSGVLHRHEHLPSRFVAARHVDVWCPPGYDAGGRFPVVYMHDGQNLFVPDLSFAGVDWGADEAVEALIRRGRTAGAIVVGIWNSPRRWAEYMPQAPVDGASGAGLATFNARSPERPFSDRYLAFIIEELKPLIDASYRTLPDARHTLISGSSMGGLISLYALSRYPEVFGGAACLSTHWPAAPELLLPYFRAHLPPPGAHRIYFDYGTAGVDAEYEPYQRRMDAHMRSLGYHNGQDWLTLCFDGAEHNEAAWRERLHLPLTFLLAETYP